MPKKKVGKGRLDKFYNMAKEAGYRSRAAYKLIQLNTKYKFLENANVTVDLCAAPGGWMQVCSEKMPRSSIKIGIDLDPIKPIPGCVAIQEDITTPQCLAQIKKHIKHFKADVVLHDGAPNVGAEWSKDAFNQNHLVLASLQLATKILRPGGAFVTKVFRSQDYNTLMWVLKKFFDKVESTKPEASRMVSAEIFVVCLGYNAPEKIDKRFFDTKYIFSQTESDIASLVVRRDINSVEKVLEKRRWRSGYDEAAPQSLYREISFTDFLKIDNPYQVFVDCSKMTISEEEKKKFFGVVRHPDDFKETMEDLKVLGRHEMLSLIKWRDRLRNKMSKELGIDAKEVVLEKGKGNMEEEQPEQEADEGDWMDESDEEEMKKKFELKKARQERKERDKKLLAFAKKTEATSTAGSSGVNDQGGNDDELIDFAQFSQLKKLKKFRDFNLEKYEEEEQKRKNEEESGSQVKRKENSMAEVEANIDYLHDLKKQRDSKVGSRKAIKEELKKEKKEKAKKRKAKGEKAEEEEEEQEGEPKNRLTGKPQKGNEEIEALRKDSRWFSRDIFNYLGDEKEETKQMEEENGDEMEEEQEGEGMEEEANEGDEEDEGDEGDYEDLEEEEEGEDEEEEEGDDEEEEMERMGMLDVEGISGVDYDAEEVIDEQYSKKSNLKKRLRSELKKMETKRKNEGSEEEDPFENDEYHGEYDIKAPLSEMERRRKSLKRARERHEKSKVQSGLALGDEDGVAGPNSTKIEVVPVKRFEDFNIDDLAGNLALAKKMLRAKDRNDIIDQTYNRYVTYDDPDDLPDWFVEDEKRHFYSNPPISKEEADAEKRRLRMLEDTPARKVLEAKYRKKRRLEKKLSKVTKKAEKVYETEGMPESRKIRQISGMIQREKKNAKSTKKKVVVSKGFKATGGKKTKGRKYKAVDTRLKKDMRAEKRRSKKTKMTSRFNRRKGGR